MQNTGQHKRDSGWLSIKIRILVETQRMERISRIIAQVKGKDE
jgi:hypothetical protein